MVITGQAGQMLAAFSVFILVESMASLFYTMVKKIHGGGRISQPWDYSISSEEDQEFRTMLLANSEFIELIWPIEKFTVQNLELYWENKYARRE